MKVELITPEIPQPEGGVYRPLYVEKPDPVKIAYTLTKKEIVEAAKDWLINRGQNPPADLHMAARSYNTDIREIKFLGEYKDGEETEESES